MGMELGWSRPRRNGIGVVDSFVLLIFNLALPVVSVLVLLFHFDLINFDVYLYF